MWSCLFLSNGWFFPKVALGRYFFSMVQWSILFVLKEPEEKRLACVSINKGKRKKNTVGVEQVDIPGPFDAGSS